MELIGDRPILPNRHYLLTNFPRMPKNASRIWNSRWDVMHVPVIEKMTRLSYCNEAIWL